MALRPVLLPAVLAIASALAAPSVNSQQSAAEPALPAYPWDMRPKKCLNAPEPKPEFCREPDSWAEFGESYWRVQTLFADREIDLALLDRAAAELANSSERFKTGEYRFEAWYHAVLVQLMDQRLSGLADRWLSKRDTSSFANIAKALSLSGQAGLARGTGFANTVSPEAWALHYRLLGLADSTLDSASPALKRSGPWHLLKVQIAFEHRDLANERLRVLEAAARAWPDSTMLYAVPMSRSQPQWGGSFALMDGVAKFAAKSAKTRTGPAMYALVYERAFSGNGRHTLRDSAVDWKMMKKGFNDLEASGMAAGIWRNFAGLACQMRDRDEARRLYALHDRAGTAQPDPSDACRIFAMSGQ